MTEREQEILAEIQRILTATLESTQTVSPADRLTDCAVLDSLGLIIMAVGLENRFRVKLSEQDVPGIETFADVIALVDRRRREAGR
jgi:acyl carrier protein